MVMLFLRVNPIKNENSRVWWACFWMLSLQDPSLLSSLLLSLLLSSLLLLLLLFVELFDPSISKFSFLLLELTLVEIIGASSRDLESLVVKVEVKNLYVWVGICCFHQRRSLKPDIYGPLVYMFYMLRFIPTVPSIYLLLLCIV